MREADFQKEVGKVIKSGDSVPTSGLFLRILKNRINLGGKHQKYTILSVLYDYLTDLRRKRMIV